ncbi:MAG: sodium:calcium antiporter, partial [Woeseiaceae bacterium]
APIACDVSVVRRDGSVMLVSAILCVLVFQTGTLNRWIGAAFTVALATYILIAIRATAPERAAAALIDAEMPKTGYWRHVKPLLIALFGLVLVLIGANWLVNSSIAIAKGLGVNESIVGLTIVAAGTSMPELVTSLIAAVKRQSDIAIGNIIGSNIFNILGILGVTALVQPIDVPAQIRNVDGYLMCGVTLLFVAASITGRRISRGEGALFLAMYVAYLALAATHIKDV